MRFSFLMISIIIFMIVMMPSIETKAFGGLNLMPPLKQFQSGIGANEIVCKEGLVLIMKSTDNSPACVLPQSASKLLVVGWAVSNSLESPLKVIGAGFYVNYTIRGGKLLGVISGLDSSYLIFSLQSKNNGTLKITIPKTMLDFIDQDHKRDFFVYSKSDGKKLFFNETSTLTQSTFSIDFKQNESDLILTTNSFIQKSLRI